jgi:hypothetical protein
MVDDNEMDNLASLKHFEAITHNLMKPTGLRKGLLALRSHWASEPKKSEVATERVMDSSTNLALGNKITRELFLLRLHVTLRRLIKSRWM